MKLTEKSINQMEISKKPTIKDRDADSAFKAVDAALAVSPKDIDAMILKGALLGLAGQNDKAITQYRALLELALFHSYYRDGRCPDFTIEPSSETARLLRPDVVFGADLIAGFPTESEDMFGRSLDIVADCGLTYLHVFPFSPRKGTPAARMPQVARAEIKERAARLRDKGEQALMAYLDSQVGSCHHVLMEKDSHGRTPHFAEVSVEGCCEFTPGEIVAVRMTGRADNQLRGEVIG
mgnify:CR=1 FL=1